MFKFLKKDSLILGIILGTLMPAIVFGILYIITHYIHTPAGKPLFRITTMIIIGLIPNAIALRLYLVNLKADKTGRGILLVTFIIAIVFVIINM